MKSLFRLFLAAILLASFTPMFAQSHMNLLMPNWRTTDPDEVKTGRNYVLPGNRTFYGTRFGNLDQRVVLIDNPYQFPSMVPLIIWAKVPAGSNEVIWNIDSDKVQIIGYSTGSSYISKNHINTPVNTSSVSVVIENPYRVITKMHESEKLDDYWENNKFKEFVRSNFYNYRGGGTQEKLYNKEFHVPSDYAFLIIQATENVYAHVSATSKNNDADILATSIAHIKFIQTDLLLTDNTDRIDHSLTIAGKPDQSPIIIKNDITYQTSFELQLLNKGQTTIDLSEALIKIEPIGSWASTVQFIKISDSHKDLNAGDELIFNTKDFQIIYDNVPDTVGVLKTRATLLYPTSPEYGKSVELDLTYVKKRIPWQLAGISTAFNNGRLQLVINNTCPDDDSNLQIQSVKNSLGEELLNSGQRPTNITGGERGITINGIRNNSSITISYMVFKDNVPISKTPYKLRIVH